MTKTKNNEKTNNVSELITLLEFEIILFVR